MMTCCVPHTTAAPAHAPRLEERQETVLRALAREGDATVAFQGLRHRLGLHQQILTRTLRRLEEDGLVAKSEDGYRVTEDGFDALAAIARAKWHGREDAVACDTAGGAACGRGEVLPVMHVLLPPCADAVALADALKGRWFKGLRWFAEVRHADEITLTWIHPDGTVLVRVRIAGGAVAVEAESDGDASERAFLATPALLGALAEALGTPRVLAPAASS